ncbi:MAG: ribosome silencing factor [Bifidobacteriaceae bacterium]|jgi:ribosome-associated protein|nr:ribosome silencing factor [Bifidobacteriaceae bacterium]
MELDRRTLELVTAAARAAAKVKGEAITALNVSVRLPLTDAFVIVTGRSDRQVGAIVDEVERQLAARGAHTVRREGDQANHWVLLDFGELVVHVQHADDREFYGLDRLWKDCPRIALPHLDEPLVGAGASLDAAP